MAKEKKIVFTDISVPKGWKYLPFGDVFEFIQSNALSREQLTFNEHDGEIFNIHYGDIHSTYKTDLLDLDKEQKVPRIKDIVESKTLAFLKDGDLIIADASEDYEGVAANLELKNIKKKKVTGGLHTFVARDSSGLTVQGFRTYVLKNPAITSNLKKLATGSKVYGVSKTNLATLKILLPPEKEQIKIAHILNTWDTMIETIEQLIAKKERNKKALMQQLLSGKKRFKEFKGEKWEKLKIQQFAKTTAGGTPSTTKKEYWGGNIKWMNSGELNLKIVNEVEGRITEEGLKNSSTKMLPKNCVLIGLAGQGKTRGTAAINTISLCINQSIAAILPNSKTDHNYLFYNIDMRYEELRALSSGDGGRGGLNLGIINGLEVLIPSMKEQIKIASVLSIAADEIKSLKKQAIHYKQQKQGLMQLLLTGQKRVKG